MQIRSLGFAVHHHSDDSFHPAPTPHATPHFALRLFVVAPCFPLCDFCSHFTSLPGRWPDWRGEWQFKWFPPASPVIIRYNRWRGLAAARRYGSGGGSKVTEAKKRGSYWLRIGIGAAGSSRLIQIRVCRVSCTSSTSSTSST